MLCAAGTLACPRSQPAPAGSSGSLDASSAASNEDGTGKGHTSIPDLLHDALKRWLTDPQSPPLLVPNSGDALFTPFPIVAATVPHAAGTEQHKAAQNSPSLELLRLKAPPERKLPRYIGAMHEQTTAPASRRSLLQ